MSRYYITIFKDNVQKQQQTWILEEMTYQL